MSPTANSLVELTPLTTNTLPLFAGMIFFGSLVMLPILSFTSQTISTKALLIASTVPGCVGWLTVVIANDVYTMLIGRFLLGVQSSALFLTSVYLGETAAPSRRRYYCSGISLAMRFGVVLIYAFGIWVPFRWLAVIAVVFEVIFLCLMLLNPISPVWLVQQGLEIRAKECLEYLHGKQFDADSEIIEMKRNNIVKLSIREKLSQLFKWKVLKPILVISAVNNFHSLSGFSAVISFSSQILSNQQGLSPNIAALFFPVTLVLGNIFGQQLATRYSLKRVLISTTLLQILSHLSMAVYFSVVDYLLNCSTDQHSSLCIKLSFWPILSIVIFGMSTGMGFDSITYTLFGEAFETNNRELSLCIIHTFATVLSILVILSFPILLLYAGGTVTYGLLCCILISAIPFEYYLIGN